MVFAMLPSLLALALAAAPPPLESGFEPIVEARAVETVTFDSARFHFVASRGAEQPAHALAEQLEILRDEVSGLIGADFAGVTEVRVALGRAEFDAMAVGGARPPSWSVALAWPEANVILVDAKTIATADGRTTLRHELVHIALGRLGKGWPRWFQEGVAQMVTQERPFDTEHYSTMAIAMATDRLYPFEMLSEGFPERPASAQLAYAQSREFVSFLYGKYGATGFGELVALVGSGQPFEQAFARAFHSTISVEETEFRQAMALRYPWWPVLFMSGTLVWAGSSALMLIAFVRRRRVVRAHRARQRRVEVLEDTAVILLTTLPHAANDDGGAIDPIPQLPWRITSFSAAR